MVINCGVVPPGDGFLRGGAGGRRVFDNHVSDVTYGR